MNRVVRCSLAALVAVWLGISGAGVATAADSELDQLMALSPGMSRQEVVAAAEAVSAQAEISFDEAVSDLLAEARAAQQVDVRPRLFGDGPKVTIKNARHKGDIYYSPATTLFIRHGHSGIYDTTTTTVEAPGWGQKSRRFVADSRWVDKGVVKQYVDTTQANRDAAADFAFNNLRGHAYNPNFLSNKGLSIAPTAKYNCSQLVWLAYMSGAGIDLDANGGFSVWPKDLRDSAWTVTYETIDF